MGLVGRADELAAVKEFLDRGRTGRVALSVLADPGMGKTALLDAAADLAGSAGWRVLRCRGVETEAGMAYAALTDLLTPIAAELDDWLPAPQRRALQVVMLRADPAGEAVEPHAVSRAVTEGVRSVAAAAPVLIVVDDLHWLDAASARAIGFAFRRLDESPVALLTARRDGESPRPRDADLMLGEPDPILRLSPLTADQTEQLLAEQRVVLPRATLRRVQRLAGGHPLYALELARHFAEGRAAGVPPSLSALLAERLRLLPNDALPALAAAAQISAPTRALIRTALDADASAVDAALDAAADARIVTEIDGVLDFAHPLLAEVASATATSAWRRRVHRRLAAVVADVEQRAVHLSLANSDPDESIAADIESGAARARIRAAPEVAAELISAALRLTPTDAVESLRRRRVSAAYHNLAAGRPSHATELILAALHHEADREGRADLEWRAGMLHLLAGDVASCIDLLEAARRHTTDRATRNQVNARLANAYCWAGEYGRAVDIANTIDLDRLEGSFRVSAMATVYLTNFGVGRASGIDPWQVIEEFEQLHPLPPPHEHPICKLMPALTLSDSPADIAQLTRRALARAADEDDDIGIAWLGATLAHAELRAGDWDAAARAADDSMRAGRRTDSAPALAFALGAAATVAAYRGDDTAAELAAELITFGARQSLLSSVGHGHTVLGFIALSRDDATSAREHFLLAAQRLDREIPNQPVMPALRWYLVDALIAAGDLAEAESRIELLAAMPDHPLAAALAATARGRVAALRGDRGAADAAFELALAVHDQQIADHLFISAKTVATHLSNTYAKLNVRSRTQLANRLQRAN